MYNIKEKFQRSWYHYFAPSTDLSNEFTAFSVIIFSIVIKSIYPIFALFLVFLALLIHGVLSEDIQEKIIREKNGVYTSTNKPKRKLR